MSLTERAPCARASHTQFQWDDPFLLELQLTEEERLIRNTARQYAQENLLPRVTEAYLEEHTDREIFREMGELGLIGVTFPEEYGCADAGYVAYGLVAREIERVDSGYRSMNSALVAAKCKTSSGAARASVITRPAVIPKKIHT
jgi:glutaryl-CoA dehydrogenase